MAKLQGTDTLDTSDAGIAKIFKKIDTDKSWKLNLDEINKALSDLGLKNADQNEIKDLVH